MQSHSRSLGLQSIPFHSQKTLIPSSREGLHYRDQSWVVSACLWMIPPFLVRSPVTYQWIVRTWKEGELINLKKRQNSSNRRYWLPTSGSITRCKNHVEEPLTFDSLGQQLVYTRQGDHGSRRIQSRLRRLRVRASASSSIFRLLSAAGDWVYDTSTSPEESSGLMDMH